MFGGGGEGGGDMVSDGVFLMAAALGLAALLAVLAAVGARALRARWRRVAEAENEARLEAKLEALRDEIWELRAAAAARDKAEAASLAKSRFLATVSHEIRTPLNGILGLAQLLAMTRLGAEQASYVEAIGDCSRSLAQLIDDILDFSKIEAGKLDLRREPFALAPLVEGVVELLAPRAQGKNLEIASLIAANAPAELAGDAARLRQVLVNLIGNAVNFTQVGGVGVRVAPDGAGGLLFEIEDTGPGIPAAARESIFEEFEQGDASATRPHGGAGLGLAISRRLVERMGGKLEIARTSPQGTTFAFTLARRPRAPPPIPPRRDVYQAAGRSSSRAACSRRRFWPRASSRPAPTPKSRRARPRASRFCPARSRRVSTPSSSIAPWARRRRSASRKRRGRRWRPACFCCFRRWSGVRSATPRCVISTAGW